MKERLVICAILVGGILLANTNAQTQGPLPGNPVRLEGGGSMTAEIAASTATQLERMEEEVEENPWTDGELENNIEVMRLNGVMGTVVARTHRIRL